MVLLLLPGTAPAATTTTVCAGCPLDAAVAAADPGDTLWLEDGLHPASSILVDKDLEIRAVHQDSAWLDPGGDVAFRVSAGVSFALVDLQLTSVDGRLADVDADGVVTLYNLLVESSSTTGDPSGGLVTFRADGAAILTASRFVDVSGDGYGLVAGEGVVRATATDLEVTGYQTDQGACLAGSPLVDAGDPSLVGVDGTRSDIGAFDRSPGGTVTTPATDSDRDGVADSLDCRDHDPSVFPGSTEVQDGVDHDCDGEITELSLRGRACGCGGHHSVDVPPTQTTGDSGSTPSTAAAPLLTLLAAFGRRRRR